MEDDNIDAVLVIGAIGQMTMMRHGASGTIPPEFREQTEQVLKEEEEEELRGLDKLFEYMDKYQKPVLISGFFAEYMKDSPIFNKLKENSIAMYPTPERAVKVLTHLTEYGKYLSSS